MARRFQPARVIAVAARPSDGAPLRLRWRGRATRVAAVEETWEIVAEWWRAGAGAARRRYYRLRTDTGLRCVVYRDLATDRWLLEQILD